MRLTRTMAGLLILTLLGTTSAQSVTVTPLMHISALGGQYFTGETHSTGMNFDGSIVPVLGLTSDLYLIPIYLGSYHETQSVYNFLGQNTLIDKQLDQTGVLRMAWAANPRWRIKPRAGFTKEWIQQSTDESIWSGLFNYQRGFGGISAERIFGNGSVELGYEFGAVEYPHYQALISDPRLTSTGITSSAGSKVLDFNTHELSLQSLLTSADKRWLMNSNFSWVRENFKDQKVMTQNPSGFVQDFSDTQRRDDIFTMTLNQGLRPSNHWTLSIGETFQYYLSNQNAFDASQTFFTPHYYNFVDFQLNPAVTLYLDHAIWDITWGGSYGYRQYSHRHAQEGTGSYMDALIYSMNRGSSLVVRYDLGRGTEKPWLKGFHLMMTGNIITYWSNTRYEVNYPYNYTVFTYLGGLSWDF
jgi:hypothetical protein